MTRRSLLSWSLAGAALVAMPALRPVRAAAVDDLAALERKEGGRLGVAVYDSVTGKVFGHRETERFAMCSTFKFLAATLILMRVDTGDEKLSRAIPITKADIYPNSPTSEKHVGGAMTIEELCVAIMLKSDNGAANLLLKSFGGPAAVTGLCRSLGDPVTRLDRMEPELNIVSGSDERDTTSPWAMAGLMRQICLGGVLSGASRERLIGWMRACETGTHRLRAGLPAGWIAGDKTGTGEDGPTNDIAVIWRPDAPAIIVTAYYERTGHKAAENNAVLAEVGRIAAAAF